MLISELIWNYNSSSFIISIFNFSQRFRVWFHYLRFFSKFNIIVAEQKIRRFWNESAKNKYAFQKTSQAVAKVIFKYSTKTSTASVVLLSGWHCVIVKKYLLSRRFAHTYIGPFQEKFERWDPNRIDTLPTEEGEWKGVRRLVPNRCEWVSHPDEVSDFFEIWLIESLNNFFLFLHRKWQIFYFFLNNGFSISLPRPELFFISS